MNNRMKADAIAIVGVAVGMIAATGCQTRYSQPQDLSLDGGRPMPNALQNKPLDGIIYPTPQAERPQPYWTQHPQTATVPATTTQTQTTAPITYTTYIVKKGDILSRIAADHGLRTADLVAANPGINVNKLKIGQKISIPSSGTKKATSAKVSSSSPGGTYVVKKGDILGRIAKEHGVTVDALKKANNLTSDKIIAGRKLTIPGTTVSATAPATTPAVKKEAKPAQPAQDVKPVIPGIAQPQPPALEVPQPIEPQLPTPDLAPVAPPTPPTIETTNKKLAGTSYTVVEGDDLYDIAIRWGVSTAEIMKANNLESDKLVPGTSLIIPDVAR